ncbi:response regulator [Deinococcus peraridilitoris]|uniref:Response regulator with CheY-like receiver domain and winged-helix DNA-binding domain protein n=1 Tax=Deinococcus peraridilitoris (strain DSM 19664 / LMG 22246 / CIP 109416 / KR-200) TaxID=937777 RepID=K9ZZP6_DEIPD|nr:response regulator [Deinococcus peraridilitoris]AFZ66235.1 response regulator with CheY-like receiver domain and winged-helix DNA-binding domain protein [Deinococcus peraridilitoris DSM 19664]
MSAQPLSILLIEQDPIETALIQTVFDARHPQVDLRHVLDAHAAWQHLESQSLPDLIIFNPPNVLDLDFLIEIKQRQGLMQIPLIVLTGSKYDLEVYRAYEAHANAYVWRPVNLAEYEELFEVLIRFWRDMARLPRQSPS